MLNPLTSAQMAIVCEASEEYRERRKEDLRPEQVQRLDRAIEKMRNYITARRSHEQRRRKIWTEKRGEPS